MTTLKQVDDRLDVEGKILKLVNKICNARCVKYDSGFITNHYELFLKTLSCNFSQNLLDNECFIIERLKQRALKHDSKNYSVMLSLIQRLKDMVPKALLCSYLVFFSEMSGSGLENYVLPLAMNNSIYNSHSITDFTDPATEFHEYLSDTGTTGFGYNNTKGGGGRSGSTNAAAPRKRPHSFVKSQPTNYVPNEASAARLNYWGEQHNPSNTIITPDVVDSHQAHASYFQSNFSKAVTSSTSVATEAGHGFISKEVMAKLGTDPSVAPFLLISENVPVGQRESDVISELIYILQGIEGFLISYNPTNESFMINASTCLPAPVKDMVYKICELGWLYRYISNFVNERKDMTDYGLVGQAFMLSLKSHLNEHVRHMAILDSDLLRDLSHIQDHTTSVVTMTLPRLMVCIMDSLRKFLFLHKIVNSCAGQCGGALLSAIHKFTITGDPVLCNIGKSILSSASKPINCLLTEWLYGGNLSDRYSEFFIGCNVNVKKDKLWSHKYTIREAMIPSFMPYSLVERIFRIGKSINFIKTVCESEFKINSSNKHGNLYIHSFAHDQLGNSNSKIHTTYDLNTVVDAIDHETSTQLLEILSSKYRISMHIDAFHRYLLLGQGDFIRHLMDLLRPYLSSSAKSLQIHSMTSVLESAIRSTNAQFDDPDVLARLDCKMAEPSPSDLGWDVFTLYYHTRGPLQTIITPHCMDRYLKIFHFLWFLKRIVYLLTDLAKEQYYYEKLFRDFKEGIELRHNVNLLKTEMLHFINQLEYFITFEVMECSRVKLSEEIKSARDLDAVIKSHENFLQHITSMCFLNEKSESILSKLKSIFSSMIQFEGLVVAINKSFNDEIKASKENQLDYVGARTEMTRNKTKLSIIGKTYRGLMLDFVKLLLQSQHTIHYSLCFRLDFNEFYTRQFDADPNVFSRNTSRTSSCLIPTR